MKIFISADMEGISGVATNQQLKKEAEYQRFRKLMTADVNAAIDGAFRGGATEVVVADGHGNMSNILIEELDERATLVSGNNRVMCQLEGFDESFDGIMFVGHHGREGGSERTVISHTLAGVAVNELKVNGKVVGETELNTIVAGSLGVPALLITGDDAYVAEVKETLPEISAAVVKRGVDRFAAELIHPLKAHALIREAAEEGARRAKQTEPYKMDGPFTFELQFKGSNQALMTTTIPQVELVDPKTVRFTCENLLVGYKLFWACVMIGISTINGILGQANA
ncbi:M55 family metallopeptidase [Alicyclobacillus dauci]|uniref:M55 family metallopeptidase n=1 Tax=Alicyclobacillus dauci TaxID=1475485 RepID=A0ABY6Z2T6_9BACL|nr:M55 family metallopeptidase [Alicyclobacillus dauci]WAH36636.1 M55 family metallopeptidase [Alicyclobacillus dauci]